MAFTRNDVYFSDVEGKLFLARQLFDEHSTELSMQPILSSQLAKLKLVSQVLHEQMASMSLSVFCKACAKKAGGGCCSAYMANETDAFLLLINMLLGVRVMPQRNDSFECSYLGDQGCILFVKPIFCLNYNCHSILQGNDPVALKNLEKISSTVLLQQIAIENILVAHFFSNKNR